MIVQCALQYADEGNEVNVIADDTETEHGEYTFSFKGVI